MQNNGLFSIPPLVTTIQARLAITFTFYCLWQVYVIYIIVIKQGDVSMDIILPVPLFNYVFQSSGVSLQTVIQVVLTLLFFSRKH